MPFTHNLQKDRQIQVVNKCLEILLRCFTFENPKARYKALSWAKQWYNSSYQLSSSMTPFHAMYGRVALVSSKYTKTESDPPQTQQLLIEKDAIL